MKHLMNLITLCSVMLLSVTLSAEYMTGYPNPKLTEGEIVITRVGEIYPDRLYQWHIIIVCKQKRKDGKPGEKFLANLEAWTKEQKEIFKRAQAQIKNGKEVCLRVAYLGTYDSIINGILPVYLIEKEVK